MTWRPWLLSLCALGLLLIAANVVTDLTVGGTLGLSGTPAATAFVDRLAVVPGGAADRAGIRDGDLLNWHGLAPATRFRLYYGSRVGEALSLPIVRDGTKRTITVESDHPSSFDWPGWLSYAGEFWIVLFCVLIALRRSEDAEARWLIFYLLGVFVVSQGLGDVITPWPLFDQLCLVVKGFIFVPSFAFLAIYADCFARPPSIARRGLTALVIVLTVAAAVRTAVVRFDLWNGWMSPFTEPLIVRGDPLSRLLEAAGLLIAMLSLLVALRSSRGPERTRLSWSLAVVLPGLLWFFIVLAMGESIPLVLFTTISAILWFGTPVILSYSLLSHRIFDIAFVVNRAAVFAGVSAIVLAGFVLIEWLLTDWLSTASHAANVLASGIVALALGLSIRFVHGRVDRFVDTVFFRKRHEDEEAIRTFAREAPYITDPDTLVRRATGVLARHTDATSVDLVMRFDENDPAIVRLRATPQPLDLHGLDTGLSGEIACPMAARGKLLGIVVLGPRSSGETYAPDETSAIWQLASSLGASLDVFATRTARGDVDPSFASSIDVLREELAAAVAALRRDIVSANQALRDEIAHRSGGVTPI